MQSSLCILGAPIKARAQTPLNAHAPPRFLLCYAGFEYSRASFAIRVYQIKHLSDLLESSTDISRIPGPASAIFRLVEAPSQEKSIATDPFAAEPSARPACSVGNSVSVPAQP
jgi:hypothetical protein